MLFLLYPTMVPDNTSIFFMSIFHSSLVGSLGIYIYPQGISVCIIELGIENIKNEHHWVIALKYYPVEKMRQECTSMYVLI